MARRRRIRKPYTRAEIKELKRLDRNERNRNRYAKKQCAEFYKEYLKLCTKYGCYVGGCYGVLTGNGIRKAKGDCMKSHLGSILRR